jgi:hypothetical protein
MSGFALEILFYKLSYIISVLKFQSREAPKNPVGYMLPETKGLFSAGFLIFITFALMCADRKFSKEGSKGGAARKFT